MIILHAFVGADSVIYTDHFNDRGRAIGLLRVFVHASATVYMTPAVVIYSLRVMKYKCYIIFNNDIKRPLCPFVCLSRRSTAASETAGGFTAEVGRGTPGAADVDR